MGRPTAVESAVKALTEAIASQLAKAEGSGAKGKLAAKRRRPAKAVKAAPTARKAKGRVGRPPGSKNKPKRKPGRPKKS